MQFRLTNSQRYLVNAKPDTNHSTNPTNPITKYRCEFVNLNCIYTGSCSPRSFMVESVTLEIGLPACTFPLMTPNPRFRRIGQFCHS